MINAGFIYGPLRPKLQSVDAKHPSRLPGARHVNHPLNVVQLDASPASAASVSRELTSAIAEAITAKTPGGAQRIHRDLAADAIPHLDADVLAALLAGPECRASE